MNVAPPGLAISIVGSHPKPHGDLDNLCYHVTDEWAHLGDLVGVPKPLCHFKTPSPPCRLSYPSEKENEFGQKMIGRTKDKNYQ